MIAVSSAWRLSRDGAADRYELDVVVPLRLVSELNARGHWAKRARRMKQHRQAAAFVVRGALHGAGVTAPITVTITRVAPSNGLDDDNLVGSAKGVRDGVADALGIDDRDPRVTWCYAQRRAKKGDWSVEIRIVRGGLP